MPGSLDAELEMLRQAALNSFKFLHPQAHDSNNNVVATDSSDSGSSESECNIKPCPLLKHLQSTNMQQFFKQHLKGAMLENAMSVSWPKKM
ncbi:hypothetical protein L596_011822 [Steinernema carpocapsae]|uniref:Uncharacterized protein n=1 Tax=Steinernema carpocapsae TaxID=34508 RepID=A0A4U5NVL4_STECR|nr:hypothetical protein L596_011822 [Steinernema carpocapsae]